MLPECFVDPPQFLCVLGVCFSHQLRGNQLELWDTGSEWLLLVMILVCQLSIFYEAEVIVVSIEAEGSMG